MNPWRGALACVAHSPALLTRLRCSLACVAHSPALLARLRCSLACVAHSPALLTRLRCSHSAHSQSLRSCCLSCNISLHHLRREVNPLSRKGDRPRSSTPCRGGHTAGIPQGRPRRSGGGAQNRAFVLAHLLPPVMNKFPLPARVAADSVSAGSGSRDPASSGRPPAELR